MQIIKPQAGFQEMFLSTPADIAVGGGAAFCGKSFTGLMEALRNTGNKDFGCTIFRNTRENLRKEGAMWDESVKWYSGIATPRSAEMDWTFPSGACISFDGIENENDLAKWQGSQIALIIMDELTEFTERKFWFMLSRNRSTSGVRPYFRAFCNPDPDSWVANLISWWIDQESGYPIKERAGVLRYFTKDGNTIVWGDTKEEVIALCPHIFDNPEFANAGINVLDLVKSFTFIPGVVYDNKIGIAQDPGYLANLLALDEAEKMRFFGGNWKIRTDGLGLFQYKAIESIYTNPIEEQAFQLIGYDDDKPVYRPIGRVKKYITCDAAKFGADFCVILVWAGWEVIHMTIFYISDTHDIKKEIELLRMKFMVQKHYVIVDQDGVGGDTVKFGEYEGFRGGAAPLEDPIMRNGPENYKNRKTQCYYRIAKRVNEGQIRLSLNHQTVKVYTPGSPNPEFRLTLKVKSEMKDVRELVKQDLRAIKRGESEIDNSVVKFTINEKSEQKIILNGRSPDFADSIMMRENFELETIYDTGLTKRS